MRKKVNGRVKGSGYERTLVHKIIQACNGTKQDCFRSPGSGGHQRFSKTASGDIIFSKRLLKCFPVSLEAKCYRGFNLARFHNPDKQVLSWLQQTVRDSKKTKKVPLLVCHIANSTREIAVLPSKLMKTLTVQNRTAFTSMFWFRAISIDWVAMDFDELLKAIFTGVELDHGDDNI